jgi:hypothetical protein
MRHGRQTPLVLSDAKSCVVSRWPLIVVYSKIIYGSKTENER